MYYNKMNTSLLPLGCTTFAIETEARNCHIRSSYRFSARLCMVVWLCLVASLTPWSLTRFTLLIFVLCVFATSLHRGEPLDVRGFIHGGAG
jgi:hypothetical protein